jgi:hypothetical protein
MSLAIVLRLANVFVVVLNRFFSLHVLPRRLRSEVRRWWIVGAVCLNAELRTRRLLVVEPASFIFLGTRAAGPKARGETRCNRQDEAPNVMTRLHVFEHVTIGANPQAHEPQGAAAESP